jgi:MerR family transcriptional regulator, light-induced transcriptional regulator
MSHGDPQAEPGGGGFALAEKVLGFRNAVAQAATDEFLEAHPDWIGRYGERARQFGIQDAGYHLDFLGGALSVESVESFRRYVLWSARVLSGHAIESRFLVENLEGVSSQLRARLDPDHADEVARYVDAGLDALRSIDAGPSRPDEGVPRSEARELYMEAALRGDRRAALTIVRQAMEDGRNPRDVYVDILQESQAEIGRRWENNQITVAREHMATAVCQYVLTRLYDELPRPAERRGRAVVTGIRGEEHQIGGHMIADMLEMDGWDVRFLGTQLPPEGILEAVGEMNADLVGISTTMLFNLPAAFELIQALRDRFPDATPRILVGGRAYHADPDSWRKVGADGVGLDLHAGVAMARTLAPGGESSA